MKYDVIFDVTAGGVIILESNQIFKCNLLDTWPKSSSVNSINLVKKICYNSGDTEFFLWDCFLLPHPVVYYESCVSVLVPRWYRVVCSFCRTTENAGFCVGPTRWTCLYNAHSPCVCVFLCECDNSNV